MNVKRIKQIEKRIARIKSKLLDIGEMRPGSLTKQFKDHKARTGAYYQLSYTHKMKSRTDYVKPHAVQAVRRQVAEYKKFKKVMDEWVGIAIELSKLQLKAQSTKKQA